MIIYEDYIPKPIEYKIGKIEKNESKSSFFKTLNRSKNLIFLFLWKLSETYEQNPEIAFILSLYLPFSHPQLIKLLTLFNYMRKCFKYLKYVNIRSRSVMKIFNTIKNMYLSTKKDNKRMKIYDVEEKAILNTNINFLDDYC